MQAVFEKEFREDLAWWVKKDKKIALKILTLIEATLKNPQNGIGKPEPLKYLFSGCWSRRITQEHRLVYQIDKSFIIFHQCRYHY